MKTLKYEALKKAIRKENLKIIRDARASVSGMKFKRSRKPRDPEDEVALIRFCLMTAGSKIRDEGLSSEGKRQFSWSISRP